ncbi:Cof-type HAD-IIB family hydrolase [Streptococcus sobrinus]|uniref:Cof-type HAD-IIB family hydrolase n=2 Tax=Streptococcus sobrinus TaxID=1310 RepID=A0ABM6W6Z3_9STRE|nr:Cof-type HAD-IIB family hydrolase [Streptococcus sobrinus]AWN21339.1 Cof-type HAD-IIB family hydrolase [Streptococcus sobrinus]EMP72668.1 phosphatase yidA [Streptococcus sobrinus DSM 20742 = ATCC 33478]SQG14147.1 HAD superfamily hydrolase [Streptococcus sobrinus]
MTEIKLLALDLDGTLFNSQKQVSLENRRALKEAYAKGVKVVITTGRPLAAIGDLLDELDLVSPEDYSITFNGGLVQRNTGQILAKHELAFADVENIHGVLEPLGLPVDVLSDGIVYSIPSRGQKSLYHLANPLLTFVEIPSLDQLPRDIVYNKIVTVCPEDYLDQRIAQLPDSLRQDYEVFKSREIILEIMPKGVHKAVGLQLLCDYLGLDASQVMAVGDEENDLTMLKWAGLGVAMANGVPLVKETAKVVTSRTNENSGVAEAVDRYILQK